MSFLTHLPIRIIDFPVNRIASNGEKNHQAGNTELGCWAQPSQGSNTL